jgi:hypothetical protein
MLQHLETNCKSNRQKCTYSTSNRCDAVYPRREKEIHQHLWEACGGCKISCDCGSNPELSAWPHHLHYDCESTANAAISCFFSDQNFRLKHSTTVSQPCDWKGVRCEEKHHLDTQCEGNVVACPEKYLRPNSSSLKLKPCLMKIPFYKLKEHMKTAHADLVGALDAPDMRVVMQGMFVNLYRND